MDLNSLIESTISRMLEGGKALQGDRIEQANIDPTIEQFKKRVLSKIPHRSVKPIGSTGKKSSSGDIDLGFDTDLDIDEVARLVSELGYELKLNRGLGEVSVLFPQYKSGGEELPSRAQIDLMIGPETWTQTQYYGPGEKESKYSGVHVRGLVNAIARVIGGLSVSPARGLFTKDDPKKQYSQDWGVLLRKINDESMGPWEMGDLQQPFEKMWQKVLSSFSPEQIAEIKKYYLDFMKSVKRDVPSELGESRTDIVPAYGNFRGWRTPGTTKTGSQIGQGNIGGSRNRGEPGYPVPNSARSRRGAEGPDDEGFQVQEAPDDASRLAAEFVRLHNAASREYTKAFNAIGARMWNHDDAHPLKKKNEDFIAGQIRDRGVDFAREIYRMSRPLTVMDSYPEARKYQAQLERVVDVIYDKYQRAWESVLDSAGNINEAVDPGEIQKGIPHLDDLKPEQFMDFLRKYSEMPVKGGIEISEKVDGSARISFGKGSGHVWTQTKNGTRKALSNQYPDKPMYLPVKKAHEALESKAKEILAAWPAGVAFMVAEVLYTRIPNSIEYGPNVIMIHGVHMDDGRTLDDAASKRAAEAILRAAGGKLSDGQEEWLFEYKRTISPEDVMVDVKKEFDTLGELYQELQRAPRDKNLKTKFQQIQKQVKTKLVDQLRKQRSAYGPEGGDVEGIVFRDLDSGQMVKLVDKDYFTKLNEFLWLHRKMLDMGGKVGGAWKKGVMQSFRDVVAKDVLGDPSASSTMLVKNLLGVSKGVTGKTPEQRADKTLAKYIKSKNLMSGSFSRDFQRSLMGAFRDFQELKNQWDQFKSKPQTMTFAGKTREFPPEHVERTERAFSETEAALRGIRAGMEAAADIKHPLTQKVALMKLFMGHKFEKLVSALGGADGEGEETVSEGALSNWVADQNSQPPHQYAESLIEKYGQLLAKHDIVPKKYISSGFYGSAYELQNGDVLKITDDPDEARTSMFLKGKSLDHVVDVKSVFRFPKTSRKDEFGIVMEKLKTIPTNSGQDHALTSAFRQFYDTVGGLAWDDPNIPSERLVQEFLNDDPEGEGAVEMLEWFDILDARDELLSHGVKFSDIHGGNIGQRKDGTWVLFDLGAESRAPGAGEVPVIEGGPIDRGTGPTDLGGDPRVDGQVESIVREQIMRLFEFQDPKSTIGVTIGRFQPFHAGHAAIIRRLTQQFSNVVIFIAGQKQDKKNPFSHDLRLRMMELSLPDVWSKIKVVPATIQGKGTGYIPGLIANAAASQLVSIPQEGAVTVLVGEDRLKDIQTQVQHNSQHQGEPGYYSGVIDVEALPGVKNDDDADRISGTRVREAIAANKIEDVKKMLDPHLSQSGEFKNIYADLREQMKQWGLVQEIVETIISELGMGALETGPGATRGGSWGGSAWSRGVLAKDTTGDEMYQQLLRSPSTRMLPLNNKGTPNDNLPGVDPFGQDEEEVDVSDPTDLSEAIVRVITKLVEATRLDKYTQQKYGKTGLPPGKGESPSINKEVKWTPWSIDVSDIYLKKSVKDQNGKNLTVGPGELALTLDPKSPVSGGQVQGDNVDYDIVKNGKKYEVKDISNSNKINLSKGGRHHLKDILTDVNIFERELNKLMMALRSMTPEERRTVAAAGKQGLDLDFIRRYLLRVNGEDFDPMSISIERRTWIQTIIDNLHQFNSLLPKKLQVHNEWVSDPKKFQSDAKNIDYQKTFSKTPGGLFLVHIENGWVLIPSDETSEWLDWSGATRGDLVLGLKQLPSGGSHKTRQERNMDNQEELQRYNNFRLKQGEKPVGLETFKSHRKNKKLVYTKFLSSLQDKQSEPAENLSTPAVPTQDTSGV